MKLLIASAYESRVRQNYPLWDSTGIPWDLLWMPGNGVRRDFYWLARQAAQEEWDHDFVIMQDDIWLHETPAPGGDVSVYSGRTSECHVCPRAFSASPEGWKRIEYQWRLDHQGVVLTEPGVEVRSEPMEGKLCTSWTVDSVVEIATHLKGRQNHDI